MSQSRRHWPKELEDDVFIDMRPDGRHAVEQFQERAGYAPSTDVDRLHEDLKKGVCKQLKAGAKLHSKNEDVREFVVRVAVTGREVVYALVKEMPKGGKYRFKVETVFTQPMYQTWCKDGKLGTLGDAVGDKLQHVKPAPPKPKPKERRLISYTNGDGEKHKVVDEDTVQGEILMLIASGTPHTEIRVWSPEPFEINIKIGV